MKKLLIYALSFFAIESLNAQFVDDILTDAINGPVKKITIIIHQNNDPTEQEKTIAWFDSIGRIIKLEEYGDGCLEIGYKYQYTDSNVCWRYTYKKSGLIRHTYCKIYLNTKGQKIASHEYYNNNLTNVDSIVYDAQGRMVKTFVSEYKERRPSLVCIYAYDQKGRLIEGRDVKAQNSYTITYLPNGNYIKQYYDKAEQYTETYIVNKEGALIRKTSDDKDVNYSLFDQYGNWRKRNVSINTHSCQGKLRSTTTRKIEYYK